jgi:hypothetical protein
VICRIIVDNLACNLGSYLLPSSMPRMNASPRSSSGLKCGSFRSGESILRPDRSEAEKRIGVDGDSPSPELGLEVVPPGGAWLNPGLGLARKLGLVSSWVCWVEHRILLSQALQGCNNLCGPLQQAVLCLPPRVNKRGANFGCQEIF